MIKETEERLAALERELASAKHQAITKAIAPELDASIQQAKSTRTNKISKKLFFTIAILAVVTGGATAGWQWMHRTSRAIPLSATQNLTFPVYYPDDLPKGYEYIDGSVSTQQGIFFYELRNGDKVLTIGQQSKPDGIANLKSIEGMSETGVRLGRGFIGSTGQPRAVIISDKSLINISGKDGVSSADVMDVINNLKPLN